ncbi:MAG TPA: tetratricopeptide repeat protein [Candidatus Aminicenantes bacterium]|nr:tetratricopeptide repeat protein [Candidatus Aminicenantes bacterium]
MNSHSWIKRAAVAAALSFLAAGLCAQAGQGRGRLTGTVMDETGKPIVKASISLEFENSGKKFEATSNDKGEWVFMGLGTGRANLIFVADGFLPVTQQITISQLQRNPPVNQVLKVDTEKKARLKDEAAMGQLEQGNSLFNERKYQEALAVFNQFAADNPAIYHIYMNIGDCYREMQDFPTAIRQYQQAIDKAKANADAVIQAKGLASIGEVHLRQNDFKTAQDFFKQSLDLNPKDEVLAYNVAEIYFNNQKVDDAIQYYTLATQIKPQWGTPHQKLGYAYLNKADYANAIASFKKFLEVEPNSDQAPVVQAVIDTLTKNK